MSFPQGLCARRSVLAGAGGVSGGWCRVGLSGCAALVLAAAVLAVVPARPAGGQPAVTLVSNAGQEELAWFDFNGNVAAQSFTTGANSSGYTLTSIGAAVVEQEFGSLSAEEVAAIRAELWSAAASGKPGSKIVDLVVPSNISSPTGIVDFAAPAGTTLAASTDYFFVLYTTDAQANLDIVATGTTDEDPGAADGWSIAHHNYFNEEGEVPSTWSKARDEAMMIRVNGYANPETPAAGGDSGEAMHQRQAAVLPGPVTALELSATAEGVRVSWKAPDTTVTVRRYIVHLRPVDSGQGSGSTKTPKAKKTTVTFKNLEAGRSYKVWVRAVAVGGGKGERVHTTITLPN